MSGSGLYAYEYSGEGYGKYSYNGYNYDQSTGVAVVGESSTASSSLLPAAPKGSAASAVYEYAYQPMNTEEANWYKPPTPASVGVEVGASTPVNIYSYTPPTPSFTLPTFPPKALPPSFQPTPFPTPFPTFLPLVIPTSPPPVPPTPLPTVSVPIFLESLPLPLPSTVSYGNLAAAAVPTGATYSNLNSLNLDNLVPILASPAPKSKLQAQSDVATVTGAGNVGSFSSPYTNALPTVKGGSTTTLGAQTNVGQLTPRAPTPQPAQLLAQQYDQPLPQQSQFNQFGQLNQFGQVNPFGVRPGLPVQQSYQSASMPLNNIGGFSSGFFGR